MKNKFYRIISPVTFLVVLVLDISVIAYAVFAVKKLLENLSVYSVIFAIIDLFAIVVGALVSKYVISQGIVFNETSFEFTALDENNIFNSWIDNFPFIQFQMSDIPTFITPAITITHIGFIFTFRSNIIQTTKITTRLHFVPASAI